LARPSARVLEAPRAPALGAAEGWRSVRQLAHELGVSRATIFRWARRNLIDVHRIAPGSGTRVRLRPFSAPPLRYPGQRLELDDFGEPLPVPRPKR
jgi:transposase-like protein